MPRNRKKKAVPDDFISFEDIDFDVDFLFDEMPNDEDLPTCDEQSNDDTIGQTEIEDEIEITTYLRKPGKSTYYSTSSYRPISLTCIMCKLMERVILERLVAYLEGNRLIDPTQEGFRKQHSTTNALLRLVQSIVDGFNIRMNLLWHG